MWWVNATTGTLYQGDCQPGDAAATDAQVSAWLAAQVTLVAVQAECERRVELVVAPTSQIDLMASMEALESIPLTGGTLTSAQQAELTSFQGCMAWIASMRAVCPGLVGNVNYQQDSNWPVPATALVTFAAQF